MVQTVTYEINALRDGVGYVESELNLDILDSGYRQMLNVWPIYLHLPSIEVKCIGKYTMHGASGYGKVYLEMQDARMPAQLPPRMSLFTCRYWEEHPERCPPCCPPPKRLMRRFHPGRSGEGFTPPQWSTPCVKSEGHLKISQNIGTPNNNQLLILVQKMGNHLGPRKLYEDLL